MTDSTQHEQTPPPAADQKTGRRGWLTAIAFVAVAAVAATGGALVARSLEGPATASPSTGNDGTAQAASLTVTYGEARGAADAHQDEVLVTTEWLAENLDDPGVVVIEVSEGRSTSTLTSYDVGHIPGAVEFVWYRDFVESLERDIVDRESFTQLAQSAGIDADSTVVLYGDANNWFAAYGAWVFKLYGFEDVRLLDGGRAAWEAEARELSPVAPTPPTGTWEAEEPNADLRAFQGEVLEAVETGDAVIIDIRGPQEYNGEIGVAEGFGGEAAAKWGHIPGAVNAPWGQIVNQQADGGNGTFKDAEAIKAHYEALGVDGSKPIIVYCRIGERASHTWYALSQILGYEVQLYDGSWTEWGNSVGVPVENPTLAASGGYSGLWGGN